MATRGNGGRAPRARFRPTAGGGLAPVNNAARRMQMEREFAQAGQVTSRRSIANAARRRTAGGTGG